MLPAQSEAERDTAVAAWVIRSYAKLADMQNGKTIEENSWWRKVGSSIASTSTIEMHIPNSKYLY